MIYYVLPLNITHFHFADINHELFRTRPGQNGKRRMDADIFDAENFWHRSMLDARLNLIEASKNLDAEMRNGIHRIHRHRKGRDARIF